MAERKLPKLETGVRFPSPALIDPTATPPLGAIDLFWIPLGAGAHVVRLSGRAYEALKALADRRRPADLYHTALVVHGDAGRFVIESAPVLDGTGHARGVVAEGPVGLHGLGRWRLFRYEIRRWVDGSIPDMGAAVASPVRVAQDPDRARRIWDLVPSVPIPIWGRDELHTGDMWNSNSLISWLLVHAGIEAERLRPPRGGRAPGWRAGCMVAAREMTGNAPPPP